MTLNTLGQRDGLCTRQWEGIEGWLFARKGLEREGTATTVHQNKTPPATQLNNYVHFSLGHFINRQLNLTEKTTNCLQFDLFKTWLNLLLRYLLYIYFFLK